MSRIPELSNILHTPDCNDSHYTKTGPLQHTESLQFIEMKNSCTGFDIPYGLNTR